MKLHSVQCLRALAVSLVVYAHSIDLQMRFSQSAQQRFFYLQNFGAIGVDIFFVISGFVISLAVHRYAGTGDGLRFLVKRFLRINPVYYIATGLYLGVTLLPLALRHKPLNLPYDEAYVLLQSLLILPIPPAPHGYHVALNVGWTLGFEWVFYVLFFMAMLVKRASKMLVLSAMITGLVVAGYIFHVKDARLVFITNPIMLEFVLGVALCGVYLHTKGLSVRAALACLLAGLAGYVFQVLHGYGDISELNSVLRASGSLQRFAGWGLPSAELVAGCVFLEKRGVFMRLWNNRWLLLIGDASYSIYLVHMSVFFLLGLLYYKTHYFFWPDGGIFIQLMLATLAGIVFYRWVEQPFLARVKRTRKRKVRSIL